ncbi:MAG: helix-turn-helix transcriptional regulator [Longimicrobiales bacterium]
MTDRTSLGEFEQLVLLACLRLGPDAYTVTVADELAGRAGREVSPATVYVALRRLEDKGLVASRMGDSTPERGGRPKRHFAVLPAAIPLLEDARDALLNMWDGLEPSV